MMFKDFGFNEVVEYPVNEIYVNDVKIQVLTHLDSKNKRDLISFVLNNSKIGDTYDPYLVEIYADLGIVYLYTDIIFSPDDRRDEMALHDILDSNGVFDEVIGAIPEDEYNELVAYIAATIEERKASNRSVYGIIENVLQSMEGYIDRLDEVLNSLDEETLNRVKELMAQIKQ